MRRIALFVVAIALASGTAPAFAGGPSAGDPLEPVNALLQEVRFEEAATALDKVIAGGELAPDQVARAYRLGAEIQAALGNPNETTAWFARWLSVDPKATLPAGASPKLREPFAAAREKLATSDGIALRVEALRDDEAVAFRATVEHDPLGLVAGAVVEYEVDGNARGEVRLGGDATAQIEAATTARVRFVAYAIDEFGNRLIGHRSWQDPGVLDAPVPELRAADVALEGDVEARAKRKPLYLRWYPYAAVSGASFLTAGILALQVRSTSNELDDVVANSSEYQFREAADLQDRADRLALFANLTIAVGVSTAAAAVFFGTRKSETMVVTPTEGGAAIGFSGTF